MFACFKCQKSFETVDILTVNFKYQHRLSAHEKYKCCQNECPQMFTSLKAFRSHLRSTHNIAQTTLENTEPTITINIKPSIFVPNKDIINAEKELNIDIAAIKQHIKKNALLILTKLNSFSNLTNKQIEGIVDEFSKNISDTFGLLKKIVLPEVRSIKKRRYQTCLIVLNNLFKW